MLLYKKALAIGMRREIHKLWLYGQLGGNKTINLRFFSPDNHTLIASFIWLTLTGNNGEIIDNYWARLPFLNEQNIVICQWRADRLFCFGNQFIDEKLMNHDILR